MKRFRLMIPIALLCLAVLIIMGKQARAQQTCGSGQTYKPECGACVASSPAPGTSCGSPSGGIISSCGACGCSGSTPNNCGGICKATTNCSPACQTGQTCDICSGTCQGKANALINPDSAQPGDLNITGSYKTSGAVPYVRIGGDTMTGALAAPQLAAAGSTGNDILKIQPGNDSNPSYNAIVLGNAAWTSYPFQVRKSGDVIAAGTFTASSANVSGNMTVSNELDVGNGGSTDTLYINGAGNGSTFRCCNMSFGPPPHCVQYCSSTFIMAGQGVNYLFGVEASDGSVWTKASLKSSGSSLVKTGSGREFLGRDSNYWYVARNGTDTANQRVYIGGGSDTDLIITGNLYSPNNDYHDNGCHWVGWFSEEGGHSGICNNGEFITAVECGGDYCDSMSIYCCGV